ncbi:YceD family protein [Bacillus marasmi]|uniref:YceD family protein n=1 Tax=Bacillus marasmi TaxID=1926279 RepID=UPI0011CB1229|nr:YceD family protein [Bacillus marasmi]
MKWTISQLQKYRNKDLTIDETIQIDDLSKVDPSIRAVSPMHITGRADISSTRVTFHFKLKGHLVLPCSRTLVDVNYPISVETTETFLLNASDFETDEEIHQVKGDVIDLMPIIEELLLLEVPLQVFCEDVKTGEGAPQSGKDWEVVQEQDQVKKVDPRLAGLAKFFEQNDSSSDS